MTTTLTEAPIRSAVETAPREVLHELQLRRLRTALARPECHLGRGMHVQEDHFLVEVIHPATLEPLPEGALGEQVHSALLGRLGLDLPVVVERPGALPRTPGKALRLTHQ